ETHARRQGGEARAERESQPTRRGTGAHRAVTRRLASGRLRRGLGLRTVDELDGALAGQALERHDRAATAEHVRALDLAALAVGLRVAALTRDVVIARAFARAGEARPGHHVPHDAAREQDARREHEQAAYHARSPCRPAPAAKRFAPSTASA